MANRGIVKYIEAENQNVGAVPEKGYFTRLCDILLINLNEYDSIQKNTTNFDPDKYNTSSSHPHDGSDIPPASQHSQLSGISDPAMEKELNTAKTSIANQPQWQLPADSANVIIKYTEYLMNAIVGATSQVVNVQCTYPKDTTIFPLPMPTIIAGKDQIVYTDEDIGAESVTASVTIPSTVNVVKVTPLGNDSCAITVEDQYGGAGGVTWFDSDKDEEVYVYVDSGSSYTLNLKAKDGTGVVGRGVTISYSNDINWGNLPTVADSDEKSGVISIAEGSESFNIGSSGTTTFTYTPKKDVIVAKVTYKGNKLNMYATIDEEKVSIANYEKDPLDLLNKGMTVYMAVNSSDSYSITAEGDANSSIEISWSPEINFTEYDVLLGSDYGSQEAQVCGNIDISCPNRVFMDGYQDQNSSQMPGYVYVCSNPTRQEIQLVPSGKFSIDRVSKNQIVYASTWSLISGYLREISSALDGNSDDFNNQGLCSITCMVNCQSRCELACQYCYGGTCHNQHCGCLS